MMMWQINQQENQSHSSEEIQQLTSLAKNQQVRTALSLRKLNQTTIDIYDDQQMDLEEYLDAQRANTQSNNPHQKKRKVLTKEQKQMEKDFSANYGKGFKMLQSMGFNTGKGLGKNQQGRSNIIEAQFKKAFTARDQQYRPKKQQSDNLSSQTQSEQQNLEQLFLYKSKNPQINTFFFNLKNTYQTLLTKISINSLQMQSINRDNQFNRSYKLQKQNQIEELDKQLIGLELINKDINNDITNNVNKVPQLGLQYQLDLLIVKNAMEKISGLTFPYRNNMNLKNKKQYLLIVSQILKQTLLSLTTIYLSKQQQIVQQYKSSTKQLFKNFPSANKNQKNNKAPQQQQVTTMSPQDELRISKYLSIIIQEAIIKNKLENYLGNLRNIQQCEYEMLDLIQIIKNYDHRSQNSGSYGRKNMKNQHGKIILQLKDKYIVKLCNFYLTQFTGGFQNNKLQKSDKETLPHHVIFPWLPIVGLDELDIQGFIYRVCSMPWKLTEDYLYNTITPWLPYLPREHKDFFINFYLAPKLLYSFENFRIHSQPSQKSTLKQYIKYTKLLPLNIREQIIQNSIALHILQTYQQLLSTTNKEDIKEWVKKWVHKIDQIAEGVIKKVFTQANIVEIIW